MSACCGQVDSLIGAVLGVSPSLPTLLPAGEEGMVELNFIQILLKKTIKIAFM